MSQENDHDFRDQHKILVLEMLTNPGGEMVTKILLHSVISGLVLLQVSKSGPSGNKFDYPWSKIIVIIYSFILS